jgi:hypothetical protein
MGIGLFRSKSSYDSPQPVVGCVVVEHVTKYVRDPETAPRLPNPDPWNWVLIAKQQCGKHIVVWLRYPDCTSYEGNKILLYRNTTWAKLEAQRTLDPHFSSNKKFFSPFARFEPTSFGWKTAVTLAHCID